MNIFLGVYACEPNKGSEPEVGWKMVNEIAKAMPNDKIYALTKSNNRASIEEEGYLSNIFFYYYSLPKWISFWKKGGRGIRTYYYLWLIGASLFMKKQNIKLDIVHHITFVNDWLPSFFYLLKTKENKFIWGAIGSHDPISFKFLDDKKQKIIETIRILLQKVFRNLDPSFHLCKYKADCIIGINENVKNKLNLKKSKFFIAEPAIAISEEALFNSSLKKEKNKIFTILSVGRLLYIKNFQLTILAFKDFLTENPLVTNIELKIIGEGQDREKLERLVASLNLENYVYFTGNISLHNVQKEFSNADLFLFPTLENAGFVTLEAMNHSLPVVAMEYGGPEQFIKSNRSSQLVSSKASYSEITKALSSKIKLFYQDRVLLKKIGKQNHQDLLKYFTWSAKAKKMKSLYTKVLNEK